MTTLEALEVLLDVARESIDPLHEHSHRRWNIEHAIEIVEHVQINKFDDAYVDEVYDNEE